MAVVMAEQDRQMEPASGPSTAADVGGSSGLARSSKFIRAGDLVIIFMSRDRPPISLTVTPGQEISNAYGSFSHDSMIGLPFGAKLASRNARGFVHLLRPNPELWTLALPHRTQIVYTPDMSFIAAHLGLSPGAKVIEAGAGSGSFSHYLTRTVGRNHLQSKGIGWKGPPMQSKRDQRNGRGRGRAEKEEEVPESGSEEEQTGKEPADQNEAEALRQLAQEPERHVDSKQGRVWSFEFHAGRALKAWKEFEDHGLFPTLSLRHRNVCKLGFGLQGVADAVFLDLPAPWEAIPHAAKALRSDVACRICCFSPCVEQVLKTVEAFRRGGETGADGEGSEARWVDIETFECLHRTHLSIWLGPGGQTSNVPIDDAIARIRQVEERKGQRREAQIERVKRERRQRLAKEASLDGGPQETAEEALETVNGEGDQETQTRDKRKRNEVDGEEQPSQKAKPIPGVDGVPQTASTRDGKMVHKANVYSRTFPEMRGHTSYLTFATLLPRTVKQEGVMQDPLYAQRTT